MTTEEILLYTLLVVMTIVAIAFLVPTLIRVGDRHTSQDEAEEHLKALSDALRQEYERLKEDYRRGVIAEKDYAQMVEEIERRALEEHRHLPVGCLDPQVALPVFHQPFHLARGLVGTFGKCRGIVLEAPPVEA